ncbi:GNAT domain [Sesbania bispinosa]|nr:GNAT domain [Sesbania bispinosa]
MKFRRNSITNPSGIWTTTSSTWLLSIHLPIQGLVSHANGGNGSCSTHTDTVRKTRDRVFGVKIHGIEMDPRHVDPNRLQDLYATCNHSCHRFPNLLQPQPLDIHKLRIALSHSALLVSVFCKPHHLDAFANSSSSNSIMAMAMADFFTPLTPSRDQLVGFGRAVSDCGLTASIYDVMVNPSLQRMGIGRMIVKKIVRMLTNREIYDIAALCSENERLFFKACGFGGDILGSTTMMYTRSASSTTQEGEQTVTSAGRKLLLVPPLIEGPYKSSRTTT